MNSLFCKERFAPNNIYKKMISIRNVHLHNFLQLMPAVIHLFSSDNILNCVAIDASSSSVPTNAIFQINKDLIQPLATEIRPSK